MYKIQIPMNRLTQIGANPMRIFQAGHPALTFNEMLGLLTENFILQHKLFPLSFKPTDEYSYTHDTNYLYITIPKDSVETRELKEGEK